MRRSRAITLLLAALATAALVLFAAGCDGDDDETTTGTTATAGAIETIEPGVLTVGSDIPYAPMEFGRAPDYKGIDIDLAREIAERLDLELKVVDTSFDTITRDVSAGKFDMVASATTITPERQQEVDFSDPYFLADQSLMVKKDSDIKTIDDVSGEVVGAQKGTTGADYANEETDATTVRTYGEIDDAFNALQAGQVEAVINDCPVSKYAERSKPELQVIERIPTEEEYGFMFKKGSDALIGQVNGALAEIQEDGTYDEIFDEYLGTDPCESITAAE
jgi:polar amino acid transport system substrate-binding protein